MEASTRRSIGRALRLDRLARSEPAPTIAPPAGALAVFRTIVWIGLATGALEVILLLVRGVIDPRVSPDILRLNNHRLWLIPVTDLALFAVLGALLAPLARVRWRWLSRLPMWSALALAAAMPLLISRVIYPLACPFLALGMATRALPWLERRGAGFRRLVDRTLPAGVVSLVIFAGLAYRHVETREARALAALPPAAKNRPNVLLIVMDTVRADHLSTYGWHRPTSPALSRLATRGVLFGHARSTAPWTLPSHASMFTGRWPHDMTLGGHHAMDGTYPTLAEFLAGHGYATAGFVGNTYYCNDRFGLGRGFHRYEDYDEKRTINVEEALRCCELGRKLVELAAAYDLLMPFDYARRKTAEDVNRDFLRWLHEDKPAARPFFAFLNYYDAHDPYIPPDSFRGFLGRRPTNPEELNVFHKWAKSSKRALSISDIELARDGYDDCIAYIDQQLGRLLDELQRGGILEETIVIVTSDHGESWGEHQVFGHARTLYRSETWVPLLILGPGGVPQGQTIDEPVSLRDLPATVLDLAGLPGRSPFPGRSLARTWTGPSGPSDPPIFELKTWGGGKRGQALSLAGQRAALILDGKVYIQSGSGREELYDLAADPTESLNLAAPAEARPLLEPFRAAMKRYVPDRAITR
jgi:arylsulfatase A-like enzyme